MPGYLHFLRCVGKAAVRHGGRALLGLVPLGEQIFDIASDALADYRRESNEAELRVEIAAAALAGAIEACSAAQQVDREVAADQPAEVRVALISLLMQVPVAVRQSLRRPEDPTGTTLPAVLSLKRPEDVVRLLPSRLPRFKTGDRPIPGVSWELVELLGVGGFGEVWKARHLKLTSRVAALKFCLDAQAARVLENEAEVVDLVMAQGPRPGIVPLLEAYLEADPPCLVYQLIEGGDLGGYIQELSARGGLSPELATQILLRLARTMAFAHGLRPKPIVHRDLKPANILVQQQGDGEVTLWVTDFGIGGAASAYMLRQEASRRTSHQQSLPSAVRGAYTPLYASPQQRRGDKPDPRDDIHALGVIWHQMLAGDLTAERPGGRGWRKKLDGRLASGLIDLLESCIDDDADERPAHAGDLAEKIEKFLSPAPKPEKKDPPPRPPEPAPPPERRKPGQPLTVRVSIPDPKHKPGEVVALRWQAV